MGSKQTNIALIAMKTEARALALKPVAEALSLEAMTLSDVEALLFHTRATVPAAIVIEHDLLKQVSQLDLITLLRRRKPLADVPIICIGPKNPAIHSSVLGSGADVYLELPTHPSIITASLKTMIERRQMESAMRDTLVTLRGVEQAYKESERMKDDLTHMLVHDLKSPIASVMGLLDHSLDLIKSNTEQETTLELLALARSESQHLLNLVANILDVRRMKEGHMPYSPTEVPDLNALAKLSLQDVSATPRERNFSFLIRPEAETLMADADLLRRILANLFSNAIKHTRRGGYIDFRAWRQDDVFVLSVRDDGEGIPEQDQKRIFNAFEQSRHTVHDRYDTGMGLTFCKLAVEKHGGKIWVESKVGRGSTFYFTLPTEITAEQSVDIHEEESDTISA